MSIIVIEDNQATHNGVRCDELLVDKETSKSTKAKNERHEGGSRCPWMGESTPGESNSGRSRATDENNIASASVVDVISGIDTYHSVRALTSNPCGTAFPSEFQEES